MSSEAGMTKAQFRRSFAQLIQSDADEVVQIYGSQTPKRQEEIILKLRRVKAFQRRLKSLMGTRDASASVRFIERGKQRKRKRIQVTAFGDPVGGDPRLVDEAIAEAAKATQFKQDFHIVGTGGGVGDWLRDTTFWEGRS